MEHARPPPELCLVGGPARRADAWRRWYKQFEVFVKASGVYKEPSDVQASLLVNLIGTEAFLLFVRAESYVLLTANVDDIHAIANQLAGSPVVQHLKDIWRRASKSFNKSYKHFRAETDTELDRSGSHEVERHKPHDVQIQRRKALSNLVELGRNASVYLREMFNSL